MMARFSSFTAFTGFKPYNIKEPTSALSFNVNFSNIGVHKKGRRSIHVQDTPKYQFQLSRLGKKKKERKKRKDNLIDQIRFGISSKKKYWPTETGLEPARPKPSDLRDSEEF